MGIYFYYPQGAEMYRMKAVSRALLFLFSLTFAACGFLKLPGEYIRDNPWDPNLAIETVYEQEFPFFEDHTFIQPIDIAVSSDGRYMAVISEPWNHLEVYDMQNSMQPLVFGDMDQNSYQDLAFDGNGILYATRWDGLIRINTTSRNYEQKYYDWSDPNRLISDTITIDKTTGQILLHSTTDDWQTTDFFAGFVNWASYPGTYTAYDLHDPALYGIDDIAASDGFLYFIVNRRSIARWNLGTNAFDSQIYQTGGVWTTDTDVANLGAFWEDTFQPMDLDVFSIGPVEYVYAYAESSVANARAVLRWPQDWITSSSPVEWPPELGVDFVKSTGYKAYNIAADPTDPDSVFVAADVKWTDPPENRITRYDVSAGFVEEFPGRTFAENEVVEMGELIYKDGTSYLLAKRRAVILESDDYFGDVTVLCEGDLEPYEARAFTVTDTNIYVSDYNYGTGVYIVKEFDRSGTYLGAPIQPAGSGSIEDILVLEDGRMLLHGVDMDNQISVYEYDGGTGTWNETATLYTTYAGISGVRFDQGSDDTIYIAYTYSVQGPYDIQVSNHSAVDCVPPDFSSVDLVFDTADSTLFSYETAAWNWSTDRFGFIDMTVSPGGFVWLLVERGLILRLSPVAASVDGRLHFLSCLGHRNGLRYASVQPLPYMDSIGSVDFIAAVTDTALMSASGWNGGVRIFAPGN